MVLILRGAGGGEAARIVPSLRQRGERGSFQLSPLEPVFRGKTKGWVSKKETLVEAVKYPRGHFFASLNSRFTRRKATKTL